MAHLIGNVFTAYVETALWSSNDESDEQGGEPMDKNYGAADLSPECRAAMLADVDRFITCIESGGIDTSGISDDMLGHDFWLTRCGHGTGFWARGYAGNLGDLLTEICKTFGEPNLYVGDNGMIYS